MKKPTYKGKEPDGQPHVRVDEYMKRRLEIKLIHSIVSMS